MPIPLGILAAAGFVAPVVGGSYDLLSTTILTSNTASVTFASLGTYAADYQHLQFRLMGRISTSINFASAHFNFNGDTAANYSSHELVGDGANVSSSARTSTSAPVVWRVSGATATANAFSAAVIDILDPFETSKNTTVRSLSGGHYIGAANPAIIQISSGSWRNTASLTSISWIPASDNFVTGSRLSLYGLRKV